MTTTPPGHAQERTGREAVEALRFEPLRFTPPEAERHEEQDAGMHARETPVASERGKDQEARDAAIAAIEAARAT